MYNDTNHPAQIEVEFPAVPGLFKLATVGSPLRDMNGETVNTLLSSGTGPTAAMGSSYSSVGQDFRLSSVIIFYNGKAYPCPPDVKGLQGFGVHVQQ